MNGSAAAEGAGPATMDGKTGGKSTASGSRSVSLASVSSDGSSSESQQLVEQEDIVALTQEVRAFKEALGKLRRLFGCNEPKGNMPLCISYCCSRLLCIREINESASRDAIIIITAARITRRAGVVRFCTVNLRWCLCPCESCIVALISAARSVFSPSVNTVYSYLLSCGSIERLPDSSFDCVFYPCLSRRYYRLKRTPSKVFSIFFN